jgi:hypothetical protein
MHIGEHRGLVGRPIGCGVAPVITLAVLCACAPAPALSHPPSAAPASSSSSPSSAPSATAIADARAPAEGDDVELVAGCTRADAAALRTEIEGIGEHLFSDGASATAVVRELRAAWAKPCLAHLARFVAPPGSVSLKALRDAWNIGFASSLADSVGGLRLRNGKRVFVVTPEILPDLTDDARRSLAPMICKDGDATCARSASYVARAEQEFDAAAMLDARSRRPPPGDGPGYGVFAPPSLCDARTLAAISPPKPDVTPFEAWAACAVAQAPRDYRYADARFRAPERGWLLLRGRRGHYQFADEARAYDLATGAAYIARREGGLILGGTDFAPGATRKPMGSTGKVSPDQLRELAFVLMTRKAIVEVRTQPAWITLPEGLPLALGTASREDIGTGARVSWSSDDQTELDWTFVGDVGVEREGRFTWPDSSDWIDDHVDRLLAVVEAGLVDGCAPARSDADHSSSSSG